MVTPGTIVSSRLLVPHKIDAKCGDRFLQADLNEAAGAADASRAMLRTSCPSVTHRIGVLAHAHFLSTAKPIAYRWAKRIPIAISPHLPQTPASSFKSLYRKRANTACSSVQIATRASDTTLRLPVTDRFASRGSDLPCSTTSSW